MLKQRIITALILTIGFGACLFLMPSLYFSLLIAITAVIAAWEWANLAALKLKYERLIYSLLVLSAIVVWLIACSDNVDIAEGQFHLIFTPMFLLFSIGIVIWLIHLFWVIRFPLYSQHLSSRALILFVGIFLLLSFWVSVSELRNRGFVTFISVIFIVGFADIGAYFVGKKIGRRKLAPNVSPAKSWEGFWGGLFAVTCLAMLNIYLLDEMTAFKAMLIFGLFSLTALAAVLGDLVESMYKRLRGIKDSSQLLPGHGGLLDRMDSQLCAIPVYTLILLIFEQWFAFDPFQWVYK